MSKILVAGGAGFIGSHLCSELLDKGEEVVCIDSLTTGNRENIRAFEKNSNFHFLKADTCDPNIANVLGEHSFHAIYDLASPASVTYITEHPLAAALANSVGTRNLLEKAHKDKAKFLFSSSSEVYGDPKEHPQKESYWGNVNTIGVRSGYDEGKRFAEALCMGYHREVGLDVKIVRIFNTYGPNSSLRDSRVVPRFIVQALSGKSLTVHGDGQQTRSFCYVSDLVEGIIRMMKSDEVGPINLGNPEEFTVLALGKKILEKTGSHSKITFVQRPSDDPSRRRPDITLAGEKLQWTPKVALDEGLSSTISYFRENLKKEHDKN